MWRGWKNRICRKIHPPRGQKIPCFHEGGGGWIIRLPKKVLGGKFQNIFFFQIFFYKNILFFYLFFPFFFQFLLSFLFLITSLLRWTPSSPHPHTLPGGGRNPTPDPIDFDRPQRRGSEKYGGGNLNRLATFNKFYLTFYCFFCYFCFHSGKKIQQKSSKKSNEIY